MPTMIDPVEDSDIELFTKDGIGLSSPKQIYESVNKAILRRYEDKITGKAEDELTNTLKEDSEK